MIQRSIHNHCAFTHSNLVAERKFHELKSLTLYIWEPVSPGLPEYHRGLLGRSIQRFRYAFQEVHRPGMASHKKLIFDCIPREASETGGPNGENWRAQWLNHRLQMSMDCSSGTRFQRRRWENRLMYQPTKWSVDRAKSVLYFLLRIL